MLNHGKSVHAHSEAREDSRDVWTAIRSLPGVDRWSVLNSAVFLLTSLPIGLAAFVLAIVGGTLGLSLSILLVGLPLLVWTIGSLLRLAAYERQRLSAFLGLELPQPRYTDDAGANVVKHLWAVIRSTQVRRDIAYMMLLFPIGLVELVLVLLPLQFIFPSLSYLMLGSVLSPSIFGIGVSSATMAIGGLTLGMLSIVPVALVIMMVTRMHARFARKMLNQQ